MQQDLEVSAVSIHAYPEIAENYALMNCGASMGEGYGPMIVAKQGVSEEVAKSNPIAVPGLKTSAYLGIRLCWGDLEYEVVPFDEIIPRILDDTYKSGLIIHEGQLTYVEHDLNVLANLGFGGMKNWRITHASRWECSKERSRPENDGRYHQVHQNEYRTLNSKP